MRIGVDVILLVRPGGHRKAAQHAAVVQVAGLDLAGHGFAPRRTDRHRGRHLLERQGQRFVEVENPEIAHARPARTDEQAARPEVDRDLLIVLSVLVEEESLSRIAGVGGRARNEFDPRHGPVVAVLAAFVHRSVAVEPDVGLAVGSLLGNDLRAVAEVLEDHAVGLRVQPRTRGTADVERRAVGADLRVVDAAAFGQVEALHDAPGSVQQYVLAVDNPVGERGRERSRGVERRLLQRGDRTAGRIAAVAGRNDGRAEGAERHQSGLIDRGDRLVGRAPLERDSGIGGTGRGDQLERLPDGKFQILLVEFERRDLHRPVIRGASGARCGRNDGQQQQSEVFFHTVRCFHQFMFSSTTDTEKVPFRRVEPPPPVVIVLFAVMRTLAETR